MKALTRGFAASLILGLSSLPALADARYELQVDGLACPFCSYGMEKELMRLDSVASAETDLGRGAVLVVTEEGQALDEETARDATKRAGFTLKGFQPLSANDKTETR